jgi:hypothetical protein
MFRVFKRAGRGSLMISGVAVLTAQTVRVPNSSFESPSTFFINTRVEHWQETAKPSSYQEGGGFEWDQLTGVFRNPPPGASDHLVNCDGDQAFYLFAVPEVGIFQDDATVDWNDPEPAHAFSSKFEVGRAYELTFGVVGGGGNMREGVTLEAALYTRHSDGQVVTVARREIIFTREQFPTRTEFTEIRLLTPTVKAGDAWAGKAVGIRFISTVRPELQGGYWDLDQVRLTAVGETPSTVRAETTDGGIRLAWPSQAGVRYMVESSPDFSGWSQVGTGMDGDGNELDLTLPLGAGARFFRIITVVPAP